MDTMTTFPPTWLMLLGYLPYLAVIALGACVCGTMAIYHKLKNRNK